MDDTFDEAPTVTCRILAVSGLPDLPKHVRRENRNPSAIWSTDVDWRRVAAEAVALVEQHEDGRVPVNEIDAWAERTGFAEADREAFVSLFSWPIDVNLADESIDEPGNWVNGQHRGAWIIDAGADRIVVAALPQPWSD